MILDEMLSEKPSLRVLRDMIQRVAPHSRDIATELGLEEYNEIVEVDHPNNCVLRCQKLFEEFLKRQNATWEKVLCSLRTLKLNTIADDTEKQLPG